MPRSTTEAWADLSARFDHLRTDLAAAFDDADLAVQRRHKSAVERLATIGKGHTGGPDRDLRDETTKQGKENGT